MGRRKIPQEVVDYARELYLTVDKNGKKMHSSVEIAQKIHEKFSIKIDTSTISRWADRYGWKKLLSQTIVVSAYDEEGKQEIEGVITQIKERLPVDEELIEKLAQAKRTILLNHFKMARKLYKAIKEYDPHDRRFPRLCEVANQVGKTIFEMLSDVEEAKEESEKFPARIIIREIRMEKDQ